MNKVTLKIIGTQISLDGEEDTVELVTEGKHYEKNGSIFLVYDESEISGMEGSTTTLRIDEDKIMMKRFGSSESKLVFEKDVRHKSIYQTVYGNMDMEVVTEQISIEKDQLGLKKLDLAYQLSISSINQSKNKLSITLI